MNLTKTDREAFVQAVIADIPTEPYRERAEKLVREASIVALPNALQEAIKKDGCVLDHLASQFLTMGVFSFHVYGDTRSSIRDDNELAKKVQDLSDLSKAQNLKIEETRKSLMGVIDTCRTLRQAKERLPEFEKYLPAERAVTGTTNLLVANVIADLTKLGWPKDQQKAAVVG